MKDIFFQLSMIMKILDATGASLRGERPSLHEVLLHLKGVKALP